MSLIGVTRATKENFALPPRRIADYQENFSTNVQQRGVWRQSRRFLEY